MLYFKMQPKLLPLFRVPTKRKKTGQTKLIEIFEFLKLMIFFRLVFPPNLGSSNLRCQLSERRKKHLEQKNHLWPLLFNFFTV